MSSYFQCQRCTACCRWPGDVQLTDEEIPAIAAFLGLSVHDFVQSHTRLNRTRTGLSLLEHPNGTCVWLDGIDCRLQEVKPAQCLGFPNTWNFPGWRTLCQAIEVSQDE
jgi:Fe-S-cluster containining protein